MSFYLHDANDAACNTTASVSGFLRVWMSALAQIIDSFVHNNTTTDNASEAS